MSTKQENFIEKRISETDIRIATFNVAFYIDVPSRLSKFEKLFDLFDADVIMLQEMSVTLHNCLGPILQRYGYAPTLADHEGKHNVGDPNPIFYRQDRLKLISSEHHVYEYKERDTRAFTLAEITDTVTGKGFSCISTHASTKPENREKNAEELKTFITDYQSTRTTPLFLLGDMNCRRQISPLSTTIASFMTHAIDMIGIVSRNIEYGTSAAGPGDTWPAKDGHMIDHAYACGTGYSGKQFQIVASQLAADTSDHLPILFDFALN